MAHNDRTQTILLGLGGAGGRIVNNVVQELEKNGISIDNSDMYCAILDTHNINTDYFKAANTNIPTFVTGTNKSVAECLNDYAHLHIEEWCPQSLAFLEQNMLNCVSDLRLKSRIAFMDYIESGRIKELEQEIIRRLRNNSKVRVMIVSSLCGNTGSGMFIQVALWIRKFLAEFDVTVRGIFMLPDIFVNTIKDIRAYHSAAARLYCNTYAAMRELNALNKIMNDCSVNLDAPIVIDGLFDSRVDGNSGRPTYDYVFFVDDKDENGIHLDSVAEYEKLIAQMVYIQLYESTPMDFVEDALFLPFIAINEPLYNACGTAKAIYPTESVKAYCSIRAVQDALSAGWMRIDTEIASMLEAQRQKMRDGKDFVEEINVQVEYIKIFERETSKNLGETDQDCFFISIKNDVKNETRMQEGGKVILVYEDKVAAFLEHLNQEISMLVETKSGADAFKRDREPFLIEQHTTDFLRKAVRDDNRGLQDAIEDFERMTPDLAKKMVEDLFPYRMDEANPWKMGSLYNLLSKPNDMGGYDFIHPVAARYVLYKLQDAIRYDLSRISIPYYRDEAMSWDAADASFDSRATAGPDSDPLKFLAKKPWFRTDADYLTEFKKKYVDCLNTRIELVKRYDEMFLMKEVYCRLYERVSSLIKQMQDFFCNLDKVQAMLADALAKNIQETNRAKGKTLFVFADQEAKEAIYQSLNLEPNQSNTNINKSVIDAIYGTICGKMRPANPANAAYLNVDAVTAFLQEANRASRDKINNDAYNRRCVELDIYTAMCKESDIKPGDPLQRESRYREAFVKYVDRLFRLSAPLLIHEKEVSDNEYATAAPRAKTFWGYNPALGETCQYVDNVLGWNANLQADEAYPHNELRCYRAVYGIKAAYIPHFNEMNDGRYYACYKAVVDDMVKAAEVQGDRAYINTPHLDKRWHKLLPYITADKRAVEEMNFFRGLWLAVAYGTLKADENGNLILKRTIRTSLGPEREEEIVLTYENRPITKADMVKLIPALKADMAFADITISRLNKRFAADIKDMDTYVDTDVLKGLTPKTDDLHPIDMVIRYQEDSRHDDDVCSALSEALYSIAETLAEQYNSDRTARELEEVAYRICRIIYNSCKHTEGKAEAFGIWLEKFDFYNI